MADESYWTYKAATPTPAEPPAGSKLTLRDWHSLSPGMRREIARQAAKDQSASLIPEAPHVPHNR
jgi:hypothetical protein